MLTDCAKALRQCDQILGQKVAEVFRKNDPKVAKYVDDLGNSSSKPIIPKSKIKITLKSSVLAKN